MKYFSDSDGLSRRAALGVLGALLAQPLVKSAAEEISGAPHIATNVYPWMQFYRREGRTWDADVDAGLAEVARAGCQGFEPIATSPKQVRELGLLLEKHKLQMRSLYVNSSLHAAEEARKSIDAVLAIAEAAKPLGTSIFVINPNPIRWGGPENKTDAQLEEQAKNLDGLGAALRGMGVTLAYHNHDAELRNGAREFHHMLGATAPENVSFCLDAHWIYRGCGDSQVAVFDVMRLYGRRVVELHLRQSQGGIWTEAFASEGDVNYLRLAAELKMLGLRPHLVLEQAVEAKSANTIQAVEAHRQGVAAAARFYAAMA